jgi:hypothetical protein
MYSSPPLAQPRALSSGLSRAVTKMIRAAACFSRTRRATSKPSMSGSITSTHDYLTSKGIHGIERVRAACRRPHKETLAAQRQADYVDEIRLVIDHEHPASVRRTTHVESVSDMAQRLLGI